MNDILNEINEGPEMRCMNGQDLYKEIVRRLDELAAAEGKKSGFSLMKGLGFGERLYYNMCDYAQGKELEKGKFKPLNENKLSVLCKKLGIEFHNPMYLVEY